MFPARGKGAQVRRVVTRSETETELLGERLGRTLRGGELVLLDGELGAGKSALARGMARGMGVERWRGSPTFNLVHEYRTEPALYHVDLYRLAPGEPEDLGLEEYARPDSVVVVEWAERWSEYLRGLGSRVIHLELRHTGDDEREIAIEDSMIPAAPC